MKPPHLRLMMAFLLPLNLWASGVIHYVDAGGLNPVSPYTNWATAATNIQDAINATTGFSDTVLVTNGLYQYGGASFNGTNRVHVINGATLQSVNGPAVTIIKGYQIPGTTNGVSAVRCVYLSEFSTLSGFTLTNGATQSGHTGGGVLAESSCVVSNCIITGNASAGNGGGSGSFNNSQLINCVISGNTAMNGGSGGGAYGNTLVNCIVSNNYAVTGGGMGGSSLNTATNCLFIGNGSTNGTAGGAAAFCTLINCTLVKNFASSFGAANVCRLVNSIIYYNSNGIYADCYQCQLTNCCTTLGTGNSTLPNNSISNAPIFVNFSAGNFRLQIGSPGIDAGTSAAVISSTDLDGNPRIAGAAVDMGAYENQNTNPVHYVSLSSPNPVSPYTNWLTAATNIQHAVGAAQPGDLVAVNTGVYTNGGVVMSGAETNRVALTNGVTLVGVYGPAATIIVGGTQMRCVYVGSNSLINGFTITNGHARANSGNLTNEQSGGGLWCEPGGAVVNCLIISNAANSAGNFNGGSGGGVYGGAISNCTLLNNTAGFGGGAGGSGALWNCTLANNLAGGGGGASLVELHNCTVSNNATVYNGFNGSGGGASQCLAYDCTFTGNVDNNTANGGGTFQGTNFNCLITGNGAGRGGGTYQSTNWNCVITRNNASLAGGGAYQGALYNCLLTGNGVTNTTQSIYGGGGANASLLVNCTVAGNSSSSVGGGVYGGTAHNSIIYFNTAAIGGANWTNSPQMYYSCTTPMPGGPLGNITNDPTFLDAAGGVFQLKCGSPCIDSGLTNGVVLATPNDLRGVTRPLDGNGDSLATFDMGAYEFNPDTDLVPAIRPILSYTTFATTYPVPFVGEIGGCADYFWWDFGDGVLVTNQANLSHAWTLPGSYNVRLWAYYSSLGYALASPVITLQVVTQPVYYVDIGNATPQSPYTNWTKAATSIQQAIAAGTIPGRLVLVTNGSYQSYAGTVNGAWLNCVALTNIVVVQSVNGPNVTVIQPSPIAIGRCGYVGSNAVLSGFTLTGGRASTSGVTNIDQSGGGVWCEPGGVVTNCIVSGNRATYFGGGAYQGTFYDCVFTNNQVITSGSIASGGATYQAALVNCLVISNLVSSSFPGGKGGGTFGGTLFNCTLAGNVVNNGDLTGSGGGACLGTLDHCVLTGNSGSGYGGSSYLNTLSNCVISANWANYGGGAYLSTLYNCLVTGNTGASSGGGTLNSVLYNCTVAGNSSPSGGGVNGGALTNCIVYGNTNSGSSSNWTGSVFSYCCTAPLPAGQSNLVSDPLFVNSSAGDFHLQPNSRCLNAGKNSVAAGLVDLDGNPRLMGGTVDLGAYEFQAQVTGTFNAWLAQYGLPTDGSADFADSDGTGMNNNQKWLAGLDPTNAASVLLMLTPATTNTADGIIVSWQSVDTRNYFLQRSTDLTQPFATLQSNLAGQAGTTSYTDTTATNNLPYFYRVGVQ